jgi:hypothetical protein
VPVARLAAAQAAIRHGKPGIAISGAKGASKGKKGRK